MEKANTGRVVEDITKIIISSGEDILTPQKAGDVFGISKWAIYKRVKDGSIPAHRIGKKLFFFKSELLHMVINSEP
jgi:excisionase family DNA binding protein